VLRQWDCTGARWDFSPALRTAETHVTVADARPFHCTKADRGLKKSSRRWEGKMRARKRVLQLLLVGAALAGVLIIQAAAAEPGVVTSNKAR
jgi:hypothetical protein